MNLRDLACCGMREISGLEFTGTATEAMEEFVKAAFPRERSYNWEKSKYEYIAQLNFSHVVFSEAKEGNGSYGERFEAYIRKNNLGDVIASQRRVNPNSGNQLKCWIWTLNKRALKLWAQKHKVHGDEVRYGVAI